MKLDAVTSNRAGRLVWPAVRALSLLAIAALQMPCSFAARPIDDGLTRVGADDMGKSSSLAKPASTPVSDIYNGNCADCDGRDAGPKEILMIAGGVSLSAIVGIFMLGFFGSRKQVRAADHAQSQNWKGPVDT
jgi:hypothetical protein